MRRYKAKLPDETHAYEGHVFELGKLLEGWGATDFDYEKIENLEPNTSYIPTDGSFIVTRLS